MLQETLSKIDDKETASNLAISKFQRILLLRTKIHSGKLIPAWVLPWFNNYPAWKLFPNICRISRTSLGKSFCIEVRTFWKSLRVFRKIFTPAILATPPFLSLLKLLTQFTHPFAPSPQMKICQNQLTISGFCGFPSTFLISGTLLGHTLF